MTEPERIEPVRSRTLIEPVRKMRYLALPLDEAFRLFTAGMGSWWPLATHSIAGEQASGVRFEERLGGQVVELAGEQEFPWAEVAVWNPPSLVVLTWHPTVEVMASTTIEVRFEPVDGGTALHLEHRDWEAFGEGMGTELRNGYEPGWDLVLAPLEAHATR